MLKYFGPWNHDSDFLPTCVWLPLSLEQPQLLQAFEREPQIQYIPLSVCVLLSVCLSAKF